MTDITFADGDQSPPPGPHVELFGMHFPLDASGPAVPLEEAHQAAAAIFEALAVLETCGMHVEPNTDDPPPPAHAPLA